MYSVLGRVHITIPNTPDELSEEQYTDRGDEDEGENVALHGAVGK